MSVRIIHGDCRDVLRDLVPGSVHCVVTSPPYWGLRDYKIPPSIWGGDRACEHEWTAMRGAWANGLPGPNGASKNIRSRNPTEHLFKTKDAGDTCQHCGAWRGAHGLEPSFDLYIANEVEIFREVWRVLRDDGTLWLNLGDSYATGAGKVGEHPGGGSQGERWKGVRAGTSSVRPAMGKHEYIGERNRAGSMGPMIQPNRMPQVGLKPKDMVGIPWRVAFALQADGWYLRQDIVWSKPNTMPESIDDRCTKAHEFIFLLTKSPRYYFDNVAIKEPTLSLDESHPSFRPNTVEIAKTGRKEFSAKHKMSARSYNPAGRNKRSVWTVTTVPFPEAHFATFPPALVEPCILAGTSARGCCVQCGAPWVRETGRDKQPEAYPDRKYDSSDPRFATKRNMGARYQVQLEENPKKTVGWYPSCTCDGAPELPSYPDKPDTDDERELESWRGACALIANKRKEICDGLAGIATRPGVVLDPFGGAGTTALVADRAHRDAILIELNPDYAAMSQRRLTKEAPLFAEVDLAMREAAE